MTDEQRRDEAFVKWCVDHIQISADYAKHVLETDDGEYQLLNQFRDAYEMGRSSHSSDLVERVTGLGIDIESLRVIAVGRPYGDDGPDALDGAIQLLNDMSRLARQSQYEDDAPEVVNFE